MKSLVFAICLLFTGSAVAVPETFIEVVDGGGVLVGHVSKLEVGGLGHNTPTAGWVRGLTTALDPATGGELGAFRFVADATTATHHNRVYFAGPACGALAAPLYFVVDNNPAPGDPINAEGRAALFMSAEWATVPIPGVGVPALSYMDPFGPCVPNPLGVLPGAASQYRMGAGITRVYIPPFSVF